MRSCLKGLQEEWHLKFIFGLHTHNQHHTHMHNDRFRLSVKANHSTGTLRSLTWHAEILCLLSFMSTLWARRLFPFFLLKHLASCMFITETSLYRRSRKAKFNLKDIKRCHSILQENLNIVLSQTELRVGLGPVTCSLDILKEADFVRTLQKQDLTKADREEDRASGYLLNSYLRSLTRKWRVVCSSQRTPPPN